MDGVEELHVKVIPGGWTESEYTEGWGHLERWGSGKKTNVGYLEWSKKKPCSSQHELRIGEGPSSPFS